MDTTTPYYSPLAASAPAPAIITSDQASITSSDYQLQPQAFDSAEHLLADILRTDEKNRAATRREKRFVYLRLGDWCKMTLSSMKKWWKKEPKEDERPRVIIDDLTGQVLNNWEELPSE